MILADVLLVNSKGKKLLHYKISLRSHFLLKICPVSALCKAWLFTLMSPLKAITQTEVSVSSKVNKISLDRTNLYLFVLCKAEGVFWHLTNKNVLTVGYNFCAPEVHNRNHNNDNDIIMIIPLPTRNLKVCLGEFFSISEN